MLRTFEPIARFVCTLRAASADRTIAHTCGSSGAPSAVGAMAAPGGRHRGNWSRDQLDGSRPVVFHHAGNWFRDQWIQPRGVRRRGLTRCTGGRDYAVVGIWGRVARGGPAGIIAAAVAGVPSLARADESPTRIQDQFFFGLHGGVAFSSADSVTHWSDGNSRAELDGTSTWAAPVGGYHVAWRPNDYFVLDGCFEVFGLPMDTDEERFDRCEAADGSDCRLPRTPDYGGFGMQTGPTFRGAVPLRYLQLNGGVGLMLPVTFQLIQEPESRLDQTAFEVGTALRLVGGING